METFGKFLAKNENSSKYSKFPEREGYGLNKICMAALAVGDKKNLSADLVTDLILFLMTIIMSPDHQSLSNT
jgi:hypothetical protein